MRIANLDDLDDLAILFKCDLNRGCPACRFYPPDERYVINCIVYGCQLGGDQDNTWQGSPNRLFNCHIPPYSSTWTILLLFRAAITGKGGH